MRIGHQAADGKNQGNRENDSRMPDYPGSQFLEALFNLAGLFLSGLFVPFGRGIGRVAAVVPIQYGQ